MPWWIWLLLILFMLCMIGAGLAYALKCAYKILTNCTSFSTKVYSCFEKLQNGDDLLKKNSYPFFTRPISDAAQCVEEARIRVLKRQEKVGDSHRTVWQHWNNVSLRKEDIDNPIFKESKETKGN